LITVNIDNTALISHDEAVASGGRPVDDALAAAFADASSFLVETARLVPDDGWDEPGLGTWSRRELAGHANRSHTLLAEYLLRPQPRSGRAWPSSPRSRPAATSPRPSCAR
jgi:hypothetical protein